MSQAYSQHRLGGYGQAPQRNLYPSIFSNMPPGSAVDESFYTGNAPRDDYVSAQNGINPSQQYGGQYQTYNTSTPVRSPSYTSRSQYAPPQSVMPQHSGGYGAAPPHTTQHQNQSQIPYTPHPQSNEPSSENSYSGYAPSEPPLMSPSADPDAAFYYNNSQAPAQPQTPAQSSQAHPSTSYGAVPPPQQQPPYTQSPTQVKQQPLARQAPISIHNQHPSYAQQQPLRQQSNPQDSWQPSNAQYDELKQHSFPEVPSHMPQPHAQPVVEEPLIEL